MLRKIALPELTRRTAVVLRLPASLGKRFLQKFAKKFCREKVVRRNAKKAKGEGVLSFEFLIFSFFAERSSRGHLQPCHTGQARRLSHYELRREA